MAQSQSQTRANFIKANPGIQRIGYKGYWYRCAHCGKWCGRPGKGNPASVIPEDSRVEIDHIRPWSQGGSDELWNLQPLCKPCNRSKSANASFGDSIKMVKNDIVHGDILTATVKKGLRQNKVLKSLGLTKRK